MAHKIHLPAHVGWVCLTLREGGFRACPVGGAVRDCLMGRVPEDWDICTSAPPEEIERRFPRTVRTGRRFGTVTVVTGSGTVEVTPFRAEGGYTDGRRPDEVRFGVSLEEDLSRRDFTVNAMALDERGEVVDLFGGREDLTRRLIRCVGEPEQRFSEDALRMLRAVRFSARLGFEIEENTARAIRACAPLTAKLSGERIRAELEKTLLSPAPEKAGEMIGYGLLDHLYEFPPECDLSGLRELPATREERWRGFCAATGFPISRLPVERKLKRAVEGRRRFAGAEWLFFDMGGTLIDEGEANRHRIRDMAEGSGLSCEELYARASALARENDVHPLKHLGLPLTPWHSEDERPYPEAAACLAKLHGRYRLGIIANQLPGAAARLAGYGLAEHLDLIVSSAEVGLEKPDPAIFRLALERAGCPAERAVMIGDRLDNDIAPAKALGMGTVWVRQGFGGMGRPRSRAEAPEGSVADLGGLYALLL